MIYFIHKKRKFSTKLLVLKLFIVSNLKNAFMLNQEFFKNIRFIFVIDYLNKMTFLN